MMIIITSHHITSHRRDEYHLGIHETRKRFKKVRAVLRLVRGEIGDVMSCHVMSCVMS